MINKRNFLTLVGLTPVASLPIAASELSRFELQGWRPIETAPKDGTLVLVCNTLNNGTITSLHSTIAVARYANHCGVLEESLWEYGTYYNKGSKNNLGSYIMNATHWMPLPEPPK
jgi:hypothetical protein